MTAIGRLTKLVVLSVTNNRLQTLPPSICDLVNLEQLWLNNNALVSLPSDLHRLEKLERLVVCDNLLQALPSEIADMPQLLHLVYASNPLEYPPASACASLATIKHHMRLHPQEVPSELVGDLAWLLNRKDFCDLKLATAAETICAQQAVFWARATLPVAESLPTKLWRSSADERGNVIECSDLSPDSSVVKDLLQLV